MNCAIVQFGTGNLFVSLVCPWNFNDVPTWFILWWPCYPVTSSSRWFHPSTAIATKGSCCHKRTYPSKAKLIWWAFPLKQQMLRSYMLEFLWLLYVFLLFDQKITAKLTITKLMAVLIMHLGAAVLECLTMTLTEVWWFFQKVWWGQRISCVKLSWSAMSEGPLLVEHQRKEEQTYAKPCITFQWNHQVWKKKIGTSCIFVST